MITETVLEKLRPCSSRWENYLAFYKGRSFSPRQFMGLRNITHDDKLWVALRLMPLQNVRLAAADIAESVLHIYEKQYPGDLRPRKAIEVARNGSGDADADAAYDAAADAANAAAYAAYADATANAYAAYAAYASAAANAAAAHSEVDKKKQQKLIRTIVLKYWREIA